MLADRPIGSITNSPFIGYKETSCNWSVLYLSGFHLSPSLGKSRKTPVSFAETTEIIQDF